MHGVAAQAVVHQDRLSVVFFAEKDLRVGCAVWPSGRACIFFTMALGATLLDFEAFVGLQANLLGNFSANVRHQLNRKNPNHWPRLPNPF